MSIIIRAPHTSELASLKDIWHTVFGDVGKNSFYDTLYEKEHTIIAEQSGKPVAMGYIAEAGDLISEELSLPCAMLYGIATLPECRGQGIGTAVVNELINTAFNLDYEAAVLCPSEDSLFEYYGKNTKLRDWFYTKEIQLNKKAIPKSTGNCRVTQITPTEYMELRESLLKDIPHIKSSRASLEYQQKLCDELGGGLYKIGSSCAIVEIQPCGEVWVKELLNGTENADDLIACVATHFNSAGYLIRQPCKIGDGRRFGMFLTNGDMPIPEANSSYLPWYGPAFD